MRKHALLLFVIIQCGEEILMECDMIMRIQEVIDFIEQHLDDRLCLEFIADTVHYSKYYLHRQFTRITGITLHDYIHRRRLTEAARQLVYSDKPILEIAIDAGYESQQAFTAAFGAMYKQSPAGYRQQKRFYPLQLPLILQKRLSYEEPDASEIRFVEKEDIPSWMNLVHQVVDGYPYLDENDYLQKLEKCIQTRQALIWEAGCMAVGAMAFSWDTGHIEFWGIHPQYRKRGTARAFVDRLARELLPGREISITTYREQDRADTGYRKELKALGFSERELLVEFGYPTQRFILSPGSVKGRCSR